jgi:hypothetical protein
MADALLISDFLQRGMSERSLDTVPAVEAARWLDRGGLLKDSRHRPGLPLRELLRAGQILGQRQELNGRWFIDRAASATVAPTRSGGQLHTKPIPVAKSAAGHGARLTEARQTYRPKAIKYVLIAESPPTAESGRFFYFEDVAEGDSLFWQTMKALYPKDCPTEAPPPRNRKPEFLKRFKDDGFFLLDAVEEPLGKASAGEKRRRIRGCLPRLIEDVRSACGAGTRIMLISAPVFEVCAAALSSEGFNVVNDEMIDFPGSGNQRKFREKFARAMAK